MDDKPRRQAGAPSLEMGYLRCPICQGELIVYQGKRGPQWTCPCTPERIVDIVSKPVVIQCRVFPQKRLR